jgi:AcrR family transcriptional regulator
MARRSDHSREQLEEMILAEAHALMAETGIQRFSAREVAKRIGYSVGTLYNVFGSLDRLLLAVNSRTFHLWAAEIAAKLKETHAGSDRIALLVRSYFDFATRNPNLWTAIYEHRLPPGETIPDHYHRQRGELTSILEAEIGRVLPPAAADRARPLARSLLATVHGHVVLMINGTFALLGEADAYGQALARVREALSASGAELR